MVTPTNPETMALAIDMALKPAYEARFVCTSCGVHVHTYRWWNFRTIPPSMDERDLCNECKE